MQELKRTPNRTQYGSPFIPSGGLPRYRTLDARETKEAAWHDAEEYAKGYCAADPYGNSAHAHGVINERGGWRGVVNLYHSNT